MGYWIGNYMTPEDKRAFLKIERRIEKEIQRVRAEAAEKVAALNEQRGAEGMKFLREHGYDKYL